MSDLPTGWVRSDVESLFNSFSGGTPSKSNASFWNGSIPWVSSGDVKTEIVDGEKSETIIEEGLRNSSAKLCGVGSVIVVVRSGVLKHTLPVAVTSTEVAINQDLKCFDSGNRALNKWLALSLRNDAKKILELNREGTTVQSVKYETLKQHELIIPPLNEQKRIVEKLEKLLGKVEAAQERLDKIPAILKRFRESVLAAACAGKLTTDWREENKVTESASDLFAKITTERKRKFEEECALAVAKGRRKPKNQDSNKKSRNTAAELPAIPESWGYFRLEELTHLVTDGNHHTPKYVSAGVPFLSVKNVRPFLIRDGEIKFITKEEHEDINQRCNPEKGDILYTKVGAKFGYAAENTLEYSFSIFVSLALIKPVHPFFLSKYAEAVINSEVVFAQARERVTGIGTPDLHLIEIRDFRIPFPPLEEQKEIVRRVEDLFKFADQIEERYKKARSYTDKLTQSILAKAFRGELVPQDPNDEPASELLARIRKSES